MIKKLGNYFFSGLFITLPIIVTLFLILFLIRNIGAPASQFVFIPLLEFFDKSMPSSGIGKIAIDFFSMLIVFAILTFLGAISQFIIGKMMISV
ncbi:MAG: hypothetical protein IKC88_01290, partial [Opitutales bacterium]|nr:hypothetical protein [Opitutales bacterium]